MTLCHGNFFFGCSKVKDLNLHILGGSTPLATGYCLSVFSFTIMKLHGVINIQVCANSGL